VVDQVVVVSTVGPMTGTAYDRMLGALEAHGSKVRMNGTGAMAQCPAHEDRDPSLSVGRADRFAGALVKCQAGCHLDDVLGAIGFTTRDLFDEPRDRSTGYAVTAEYPYTDEHGVVQREFFGARDYIGQPACVLLVLLGLATEGVHQHVDVRQDHRSASISSVTQTASRSVRSISGRAAGSP